MAGTDDRIALMPGDAALPRKNGELVFEAPWEGRVFGLAVALSDGRQYPWDSFRDELIAEIAAAEATGAASTYYERWLSAFERLLVRQELLTPAEIDRRAAELTEEED
jgi:nitrile hydratase accessory protein